jgi:Tfp pilus assembly protein PilN
MRAVNLLPRDAGQAKSLRNEDPAVVVGSAVGLIVLIALSLGFFVAHSAAGAQQRKLTAARIELGKLSLVKRPVIKVPKLKRPIIPIPAVTGQEAALLQAVSGAMSTRIAWDRILREFSLVVPDDVTITTLNLTAPSNLPVAPGDATTAATPQGLILIGTAYSHDSVARLLSRLMLIPDLTDVTLSSSTAQLTGGPGVQFNIAANVKGAPPPPAPAPATTPTDTGTTTGATQ